MQALEWALDWRGTNLNSQTSQSVTRLQSPGGSSSTGEISQLTNSAISLQRLLGERAIEETKEREIAKVGSLLMTFFSF